MITLTTLTIHDNNWASLLLSPPPSLPKLPQFKHMSCFNVNESFKDTITDTAWWSSSSRLMWPKVGSSAISSCCIFLYLLLLVVVVLLLLLANNCSESFEFSLLLFKRLLEFSVWVERDFDPFVVVAVVVIIDVVWLVFVLIPFVLFIVL